MKARLRLAVSGLLSPVSWAIRETADWRLEGLGFASPSPVSGLLSQGTWAIRETGDWRLATGAPEVRP